MPQCVAQQDPSAWLSAMTGCTARQCTRHFGVICTHRQWLTQLSCLKTAFSPQLVRAYAPYCGRSVLAMTQLYQWIRAITGRTWLVHVGDAFGLQVLSPASLVRGYAHVDVTDKAPACLSDSVAATSMESFQHVMASCGFTSYTRHTGNAARPWEYSESQRSMIALDSETAGYDLTGHSLAYGNYFDKRCFCDAFTINLYSEPCSGLGLALTKERLWLNATCGPAAVPGNWTDGLLTTTFDYIPTDKWRWPSCVSVMPKKVIGLAGRCTTDACELDSRGYCNVKRAVDRACFCSDMRYDTCKGSCHIFETRIDYVNWLHDLCGRVEGWHGLPKHWHQLAAPMPLDMIPWGWSINPFRRIDLPSNGHWESSRTTRKCASTSWYLASLVLINGATLLAGLFGQRGSFSPVARAYIRCFSPRSWFLPGLALVALHLFANWINAALIQSTTGYEGIPIAQLVLLWCSLPRFTWATVLFVSMQPFKAATFYMAASHLFAESVLQTLSAYHMISTVTYGREHNFYGQAMARLQALPSAQYMYAGALMWLVVVVVSLALVVQIMWQANSSAPSARRHERSSWMRNHTQSLAGVLFTPFDQRWTRLEDKLAFYWTDKTWDDLEETPLLSEGYTYAVYGTLPTKGPATRILHRRIVRLTLLTIISMCLLCIAQWFFWAGFIGLGEDQYVSARDGSQPTNRTRYCPSKLGLLTLVWIVSSVIVTLAAVCPGSVSGPDAIE